MHLGDTHHQYQIYNSSFSEFTIKQLRVVHIQRKEQNAYCADNHRKQTLRLKLVTGHFEYFNMDFQK